jgi:DNA-binding PadR family transcriptional regulator
MNDLIVLATLLAGPKHGYRIKKEAGWISGEAALHSNLVYPMLRCFETNGWVSRTAAPGERGQTKQLYVLTPVGRQELTRLVAQFGAREAREAGEFLMRVGLFSIIPSGERLRILDQREEALRARKAKFEAIAPSDFYADEVVDHLLGGLDLEIQWISRLRKSVQEPPATAAKPVS